jgi:DNA primase
MRRDGKKAFEDRISGARDFFDYWIEREMVDVNLASLSAKMQLARSLAETVSRVNDPLLRGEVVSKVSARLGVPSEDFRNLLPRQRPGLFQRSQPESGETAPLPRHDVAMLCLLALRDADARQFVRSQNWREVLAQVPDADLLVRILEAEFDPNEPASVNAFMAALPPAEERLVSSWLLQKLPPKGGAMVEKWWLGIRQAIVRRQLEVAENRIKLPQHSTGDVVNLQKQILDLQDQLRELSEFSPARVADS